MQLKRKRSCSELSSSPSAISQHSPPAHLGGRTMKRFRNSRPSEETIHRNTLSVLFNAQRTAPSLPLSASPSVSSSPSSPSPSSSSSDMDTDAHAELLATAIANREHGQASLHRFWKHAAAVQTARATSVDVDGDMDMNRAAGEVQTKQPLEKRACQGARLGWVNEGPAERGVVSSVIGTRAW